MEKLRLIRRFGAALLKLCPGKVAAYLICSFVSQTAIPLAIPLAVAKRNVPG